MLKKYRGKIKNYRNKYFITGFFEVGKTCIINQNVPRFAAIASTWNFFQISDCFELSNIIKKEIRNARYVPKRLSKNTTEKILKHFSTKKDATKHYILHTKELQS